jgi:hypothetical protein
MSLPIIPIQILATRGEIDNFIEDCLHSLTQQVGLGETFQLAPIIATHQPVDLAHMAALLERFQGAHFHPQHLAIDRYCGYGEKQNLIWNTITRAIPRDERVFVALNPDTIVHYACIQSLWEMYLAKKDTAFIVEARQFPHENPYRHFNPETYEIAWSSGACALYADALFEIGGGFDEHIFLYCEDVDLSWQAWQYGKKCYYCPWAYISHMTNGLFRGVYQHHKAPQHAYYMGMGHLILAKKYFGHDAARFAELVAVFEQDIHTAQAVKQRCLRDFRQMESDLMVFSGPKKEIHMGRYGEFTGDV